MKEILFETDDYKVLYERNSEIDKKIVDLIINEFRKRNCGSPESVADDEDFQCEGANILAEIAEILKIGAENANI